MVHDEMIYLIRNYLQLEYSYSNFTLLNMKYRIFINKRTKRGVHTLYTLSKEINYLFDVSMGEYELEEIYNGGINL